MIFSYYIFQISSPPELYVISSYAENCFVILEFLEVFISRFVDGLSYFALFRQNNDKLQFYYEINIRFNAICNILYSTINAHYKSYIIFSILFFFSYGFVRIVQLLLLNLNGFYWHRLKHFKCHTHTFGTHIFILTHLHTNISKYYEVYTVTPYTYTPCCESFKLS